MSKRTKIFPNVWQVLFYENYAKSRSNEMYKESVSFFGKKLSDVAEYVEEKSKKKYTIIEKFSSSLVQSKNSRIIVLILNEDNGELYYVNTIDGLINYLKNKNIIYFPEGTRLFKAEGTKDDFPITYDKNNGSVEVYNAVKDTELLDKFRLSILLFGEAPDLGRRLTILELRAINNVKNLISNVRYKALGPFIGKKLAFSDNIIVFSKLAYEEVPIEPVGLYMNMEEKIRVKQPEVEPKIDIFSHSKELEIFKPTHKPLIETFSKEQVFNKQYNELREQKIKEDEKSKEKIINNLVAQLRETNVLIETTIPEDVKATYIKKRKGLMLKLKDKYRDFLNYISLEIIDNIKTISNFFTVLKLNDKDIEQSIYLAVKEIAAEWTNNVKKTFEITQLKKFLEHDNKDIERMYKDILFTSEKFYNVIANSGISDFFTKSNKVFPGLGFDLILKLMALNSEIELWVSYYYKSLNL